MPKGGDRGGRKPLKWKIRDGAPRPVIRLEVPKDFRPKLEAIALAWDKGLISVEQIDELLTHIIPLS